MRRPRASGSGAQTFLRHQVDEPDALDWAVYRVCVDWCLDEGIEWVGDLADRMLPPREFEQLWLLRCRRMQEELARLRGEG